MGSADSVVMLGGPDHGKRFSVRDTRYMEFVELPHVTMAWDDFEKHIGMPTFERRTLPIVEIKLGAGRARGVAYYPEISREVAQLMLGDFVYAAWEKYEIKTEKRRY